MIRDLETILKISYKVYQKFGIKFAYLFGSLAKEDPKYTDIDIAILFQNQFLDQVEEFEQATSFKDYLEKNNVFEQKLEVVSLGSANPLFRFEAIKPGKILFAQDIEERIAFELRVIREYEDYRAKSRIYEKVLREKLASKLQGDKL